MRRMRGLGTRKAGARSDGPDASMSAGQSRLSLPILAVADFFNHTFAFKGDDTFLLQERSHGTNSARLPRIRRRPIAGGRGAGYTSPTLVLLAMDWPAGKQFSDFLGFAILRSPGFNAGETEGYLRNKIGFDPPTPDSQPLPSNLAPFQKFLWWDAGIKDSDPGKTFKYTITPVRGTGPNDLVLQHDAETTISVTLPQVEQDGIATWFNRAVVSSQAFSREFPDPQSKIPELMDWLANGLEDAFAQILSGAKEIDGAIYHLTDKRWVVPALEGFASSS